MALSYLEVVCKLCKSHTWENSERIKGKGKGRGSLVCAALYYELLISKALM